MQAPNLASVACPRPQLTAHAAPLRVQTQSIVNDFISLAVFRVSTSHVGIGFWKYHKATEKAPLHTCFFQERRE